MTAIRASDSTLRDKIDTDYYNDTLNEINTKYSDMDTYISNLQNLHKIINNKKDIDSLEFLEDMDKVLDALKEKSMQTIKNYLVPVVISLSSEDKYKTLIEKYNMKIKELQDKILDIYDQKSKKLIG